MKKLLSFGFGAALAAAALAACGGGGSSGGYSPQLPQQTTTPVAQSSDTPPTPPVSTTPAPVSTTPPPPPTTPTPAATPAYALPPVKTDNGQEAETMQGAMLAGLSGSSTMIANTLNFSPISTFGAKRIAQIVQAHRMSTPACSNQEIETSNQQPNGLTTYVVYGFANSSCTGAPEYQLDLNAYATAKATSFVGNGLETFYNTSGGTVAQNTLEYVSISGNQVQTEGTFASYYHNGSVSSSYGLTCAGTACGSAMAINDAYASVAFGSVVSTNGGQTTVQAYVAPVNALSVQLLASNVASQTLPFYQINGGVSPDTVTLSVNGSGYSMVDTSNGAKVNVTVNTDASVTGYVIDSASNTQLASFNIDKFGLGTLQMSDGTTEPIAGFMVI